MAPMRLWILILLGLSYSQATIYKVVKDPAFDKIQVTFALPQKNGLRTVDKQRLLDMHNALRLKIATGQEKKMWDGGNGFMTAPSAANMQAMEWDDELASFAQNHVNKCTGGHSNLKVNSLKFKKASIGENLSGDITAIEEDMYGEVQWWNFDRFACKPGQQCGHYRHVVGWGLNFVGCGWKVCKENGNDLAVMVCVYAGHESTATEEGKRRLAHQHEYLKGPPCSACEQGWDFCMGGGLCATKKQCDSDPSNQCKCLHTKNACTANGGRFDPNACTCTCPAGKMGINCAKPCKDKTNFCFSCDEPQTVYECPKECNACGKAQSAAYKMWYVKSKTNNKDGIRVRYTFEDPDAKAEKTDMTKKPMYGKCKNKANNIKCEILFLRGYCQDLFFGNLIQNACGLSCNTCGKAQGGNNGGNGGTGGTGGNNGGNGGNNAGTGGNGGNNGGTGGNGGNNGGTDDGWGVDSGDGSGGDGDGWGKWEEVKGEWGNWEEVGNHF